MKGLLARLERLEGARPSSLPAGCRNLQEWTARLAKHRARPLEDHGALFPAGGEEPFKWAVGLVNARIAQRMSELGSRDWARPRASQKTGIPEIRERTTTKRQQLPEVDRLAPYRDPRDIIVPEPEPE